MSNALRRLFVTGIWCFCGLSNGLEYLIDGRLMLLYHSGGQVKADSHALGPMVTPSRYLVIEEIDTRLSPPEVFELFRDEPFSFFLDSGMDPGKLGRCSFIGSCPFLVLKTRGTQITVTDDHGTTCFSGDPFDALNDLLKTYHLQPSPLPVPFIGGAVGYLSYDLCRFIERLHTKAVDDLQLPECYFGFYDRVLTFDNLLGRVYIVSTGFPELRETKRLERAHQRLAELKDRLADPLAVLEPPASTAPTTGQASVRSNFTRQGYIEAIEKARRYIIAGDIFEVNLSQRFEAELTTSPYELYRRLRRINPAPFACYLDFDELKVASASPERFLRTRGDWVETRPIKGTRRRGTSPEEDKILAKELLNSVKDSAENIMIVDLERNDLGRVCRYGTVQVTELAILETYPTVFHLTSTVEGRLREGKNCIDLLRATFPGGSITGAPKIRAMEIIDELEPTRRSLYTGSIGYLGFNGDIDLNIVIRTFLVKGNMAYFQAGGAVVYDSNPEAEYQETLDKARALIASLNTTAGGEV
jgi:para-aminobenzoate synthetase component 1